MTALLTDPRLRRAAAWAVAIAFAAVLVVLAATASTGPTDPTQARPGQLSDAQVIFNSGVIVFREGLEAVLIFAAVAASLGRAETARNRRPMALGAGVALAATVATWFAMQAVLHAFAASAGALELEAITGLVAIVVLLVVMNWFFHKLYWTGWIARKHRARRRLLAGEGRGWLALPVLGFVALGFTSVYREGFEVVLFLQSLQLKAGTAVVLEGVAIGLAGTAAVGVATFALHRRLPYRRMLVLTGVLLGIVLVVMVGGTARTFQDVGWLSSTSLGVHFPGWLARWFEIVPSVETLGAQLAAAVFVVGSYFLAEHLKVRRPRRRATRAAVAPAPSTE